jgi:hypothetical protein
MRGIAEMMPLLMKRYEIHIISRIGQKRPELDWIGDMKDAVPALASRPDDFFHFCSEPWEKTDIAKGINSSCHIDNSVDVMAWFWKEFPSCDTILFKDYYNSRSLQLLQTLNAIPPWNTVVEGWQDCKDILLP